MPALVFFTFFDPFLRENFQGLLLLNKAKKYRTTLESRKTKTKVITLVNHKDTDNPVNQSKLVTDTCSQLEAREIVRVRVAIGFRFTSAWLRKRDYYTHFQRYVQNGYRSKYISRNYFFDMPDKQGSKSTNHSPLPRPFELVAHFCLVLPW